jgi:hypothetical protein
MTNRQHQLLKILLIVVLSSVLWWLDAPHGAPPKEGPASQERWPFARGRWQSTGLVAEYPAEGALGAPDRAYILKKCEEANAFLLDIGPIIQEINHRGRPSYEDLLKHQAAVDWAKGTAELHRKIFEGLAKHPGIQGFEVLLPEQHSEKITTSSVGCVLHYDVDNRRRELAIRGDWPSDQTGDFLNSANCAQYILWLDAASGSQGGFMDLITRMNLIQPFQDPYHTAGLVRFSYCFNPFAVEPVPPSSLWGEVLLIFSEDYSNVRRIK